MRIANHAGRAVAVLGETVADLATLSGGAFGPDLRSVYEHWDEVRTLLAGVATGDQPLDHAALGCPVPEPRQVFAIGVNYRSHAAESTMDVSAVPPTFTKFPSALAGPFDDIEIVGDAVDWEVELVVVLGRHADRVPAAQGWSYVAGLTVGQDISDRALQFAAGRQFSLGKSRRGYGPMGPWVVSVDEFADPDDLALECRVDGVVMQSARTSEMVFNVPQLIAELSAVTSLYAGDIIFTGTPAGVGFARQPPLALHPGTVLETWIDGIGTMRNRCI